MIFSRILFVCLLLTGCFFMLLGFFYGVMSVGASSGNTFYRVVGAMKDSTLEKEINEAFAEGCVPLFGVGAGQYNEGMVVLECR